MTLTNNFRNWCTAILTSGSNASTSKVTTGNGLDYDVPIPNGLKDENNNNYTTLLIRPSGFSEYQYQNVSLFCFNNLYLSAYYVGTLFGVGSGNTPASVEDYKLVNKLDNCSTQLSANYANGKIKFDVIVSNNGTTDAVIKEIGMYKNIVPARNQQPKSFLFGRVVLDEGVTIAAGDTDSFTVTFSLF